jgi:hypothetical protein
MQATWKFNHWFDLLESFWSWVGGAFFPSLSAVVARAGREKKKTDSKYLSWSSLDKERGRENITRDSSRRQ